MTVSSSLSDKSNPDIKFVPTDLCKALAAEVVVNGKLVPNPYKKWSEINPALPDIEDVAACHSWREAWHARGLRREGARRRS